MGKQEADSAARSTARITGIEVRALSVPMSEPHRTASGVITESPLVLTDVITDEGSVGHSIVFTYTAAALLPTAELVRNLAPLDWLCWKFFRINDGLKDESINAG